MKCPNCGYVSFTETEKCKKCGSLLHKEPPPEAAAAPAGAESVTLRKAVPPAPAVQELPLREDAIPTPVSVEPQPAGAQPVPVDVHPPPGPEVKIEEAPPPEVVPVPAEVWKSDIKKKVQARREKAAAVPPPAIRHHPKVEKTPQMAKGAAPAAEPHEQAVAAEVAGPREPTLSMGPPPPLAQRPPVEKGKAGAERVKKLDQQPLFTPELLEERAEETGEPTTGIKALAALCDTLVVAIPWIVAVFSAQKVLDQRLSSMLAENWLAFALLFVVFHTMYDLFFLPSVGVTPGLALFGMRFSTNGHHGALKAALFSVVSLLSLGVVGAGFIWAIFDPDRRCWHELASSGRLVYAS
ncbi:MAG: RDD family protein [Acidobacteriota bacterium]